MGHFPFQHPQQRLPAWKQTDSQFGYCQQLQKSEANIYNWVVSCPEHLKDSISSWMLLSSFLWVKLNFSCSTFPLTAALTRSAVEDSFSWSGHRDSKETRAHWTYIPSLISRVLMEGCSIPTVKPVNGKKKNSNSFSIPLDSELCFPCLLLSPPSNRRDTKGEDAKHPCLPGGGSSSCTELLPLPEGTWWMPQGKGAASDQQRRQLTSSTALME